MTTGGSARYLNKTCKSFQGPAEIHGPMSFVDGAAQTVNEKRIVRQTGKAGLSVRSEDFLTSAGCWAKIGVGTLHYERRKAVA